MIDKERIIAEMPKDGDECAVVIEKPEEIAKVEDKPKKRIQ